MKFDREIMQVLAEVGDNGLSVKKISIHVHNACNTFFEVVGYDDVHAYVAYFLSKHSRGANSLVEHTSRRGVYRLNRNSAAARQLMLSFSKTCEAPGEESAEAASDDSEPSLPLF